MKSWTDFLANLFWHDERGDWWSLGDEHLNHMLLVMLLKEEPRFLQSFTGAGERRISKASFGSGKLQNSLDEAVSELDIHVEAGGITTLIEIKTWSGIKAHQRPSKYSRLLTNSDRYRLLYILLTEEAAKSFPAEEPLDQIVRDKCAVIDRAGLVSELDNIKNSQTMGMIASDYASALRSLPIEGGWTK